MEEAELLALLEQEQPRVAAEIEAKITAYSQQPYITALSALQPMIEQIVSVDRPATITRRIRPWHRAAAAAAIFLVAVTSWLFFHRSSSNGPVAAVHVAPGSNKATLTLADGSSVELDNNGSQVLHQGNTQVKQSSGSLSYSDGATADTNSYNTLKTPRGGQFRLQLPDGTGVWLNAASTLKYPVAFSKKERVVEVSGEAYFEIAQDAHRPFTVKVSNGGSVEVLGTRFNISAYPDDNRSTTTLLEGAVRVMKGRNTTILKPGQQAIIKNAGDIDINDQLNIEKIIAWKNGLFNFEGAGLQEVMKELERWYNIEVVYEKGIPDLHFGGEMSRNLELTEVLKGLEDANVHFRLEQGKRLVVMP
nr:FecR family protein [uncultured Chitinophaga sp.]